MHPQTSSIYLTFTSEYVEFKVSCLTILVIARSYMLEDTKLKLKACNILLYISISSDIDIFLCTIF